MIKMEEQKINEKPQKSKRIIIAWVITIALTIFIAFLQLYLWSQFIHKA